MCNHSNGRTKSSIPSNFVDKFNHEANSTTTMSQIFDLMTVPAPPDNLYGRPPDAQDGQPQVYALGAPEDQLAIAQSQNMMLPPQHYQQQSNSQRAMAPMAFSGPQGPPPQPQMSLYIDQFGNQQLGSPNQPPGQQYDTSQSRMAYLRPGYALQNSFYNTNQDPRHPQQPSRGAESQVRPSKLSNDQLMSLIDELKDFNRRHSRGSTNAVQQARESNSNSKDLVDNDDDDEPDNETGPSSVETKHNSATTTARDTDGAKQREEPSEATIDNKDMDKLSTEDLERFAKFLMTKEGANMRFQLGLDKDSPDDGEHDGDERDALLESKQLKRRKKKDNQLNELDRKAGLQMDRLINELMEKFKKSSKMRPAVDEREDELLARRARRDTTDDDAAGLSLHPGHSTASANKNVVQVSRRSGESDEDYPKKARRRDHIGLIHELQRARKKKAALRSRSSFDSLDESPEAPGSIVKQSLDGKLGMRTETHPDGRLVLRTGKGHSLTLKMPKKREGNDEASSEAGAAANDQGKEQESTDKLVDKVKIKGNQGSLKDEYPISERVSDRLAKLNHNLDRYFNDGFLKEMDKRNANKDSHQASPSNVNASAGDDETSGGGEASKNTKGVDHDFDVNVGIDGKRDDDRPDPDEDDSDLEGEPKKKNPNIQRHGRRHRRGDGNSNTGKLQTEAPGHGEPRNNNEDEGHSVRNDLSAGEQHVTFESQVSPNKMSSSLDPVDSETIDSPIGPDGDPTYPELIPAEGDKRFASSHESRKVAQRTGKPGQVTNKFFEEPVW